jgi:hypothetical protein
MRRYLLSIALVLAAAATACGAPPSYLLLRQPESPRPKNHPGQPAAEYYDVRTDGYAYGYFGAAPRSHWSRHFGVHRMYTQWMRW